MAQYHRPASDRCFADLPPESLEKPHRPPGSRNGRRGNLRSGQTTGFTQRRLSGLRCWVRKVQPPQGRLWVYAASDWSAGCVCSASATDLPAGRCWMACVEAPFTAGRVGPPQFAPQDTVPVSHSALGVRVAMPVLDRAMGERHRAATFAAPGDLGFGETCCARISRGRPPMPVAARVGECLERKVKVSSVW